MAAILPDGLFRISSRRNPNYNLHAGLVSDPNPAPGVIASGAVYFSQWRLTFDAPTGTYTLQDSASNKSLAVPETWNGVQITATVNNDPRQMWIIEGNNIDGYCVKPFSCPGTALAVIPITGNDPWVTARSIIRDPAAPVPPQVFEPHAQNHLWDFNA